MPRPPDLVSNTTGPEPLQSSVTTTSFAGLWYSRVESKSQPQRVIDTMSSWDMPRLQPRTVIRVPPDEGPVFGESPVISGARLEESTWPRVGARRGLKRVGGARVVLLEEVTGDNSAPDFSILPSALSSGRVYKFSIDLDPLLEIEAFSIETLRFVRSFVPVPALSPKGIKLFNFRPSPELFLNESTQQSIQRSPIAWAFFAVNGIQRRRCATEGIWASGKLTEPRTSSLSMTVKTSAAALVTLLKDIQQVLENERDSKHTFLRGRLVLEVNLWSCTPCELPPLSDFFFDSDTELNRSRSSQYDEIQDNDSDSLDWYQSNTSGSYKFSIRIGY